ncbi:MAG: 3-dehydroquinate synthase [Bacteroidales bacterium]|nr:3-dehydroquinate synthase [Bacteroidales bacterium]
MVTQRLIPGTGVAGLASLLQNEREVFLVCDAAVHKNTPFLYTEGPNCPDRAQNDPVFVHRTDEEGPVVGKNASFCTRDGENGPAVGENGLFCTPVGGEAGLTVGEVLKRALGERFKGEFLFDASEAAKGMSTVVEIERAMMEAGLSRGGLVLSIGGGITTDVGGFAASLYKRGVRFANVPTTLLAMVDAAIGGKTGVNLDGYKNMVGVIRQPEFVYIDDAFLQTLPEREMRCGVAELLKTFLLGDARLYEEAVANLPHVSREHILAAGRIKEAIVADDPFESGRRMILNLGHTFAHAIEKLSDGAVAHGEAVAMGIVLACRLSDRLGVSDGSLEAYVREGFKKAGLPLESPYSVKELSGAMSRDKKAAGEKIKFILLESPGKPVIKELVLSEVIKACGGRASLASR